MKRGGIALLVAVMLAGCGASHDSRQTNPKASARSATTAGKSRAAKTTAGYVAPVSTIQLVRPLTQYTIYADKLLVRLHRQVGALHDATLHHSLRVAEADWTRAHFIYLEIGQDDAEYGAFGNLGEQIDGLAAGRTNTVRNPGFTGFHKVELDLWRRRDKKAAAIDAARLVSLVAKLTPTEVRIDLPLDAPAIDAWVLRCHEILEDALRDSLSQADDYGSNTDLSSLAADVNATHEMLDVLQPLINTRRPKIVPDATLDLRVLKRAIVEAGGPRAQRNLRSLPHRQRQALDAAAGAAAETLAPVSEILQVIVPGS